jgi:hypothetical protein
MYMYLYFRYLFKAATSLLQPLPMGNHWFHCTVRNLKWKKQNQCSDSFQ